MGICAERAKRLDCEYKEGLVIGSKSQQDTDDHESGAGSWGCPHELRGICQLMGQPCRPGVRGCVLYKRINKTQVRNIRPDAESQTAENQRGTKD